MNKAALVTGAAHGIGRGIALALAGAGFDVAIHYRGSKSAADAVCQEISALGKRAVALQADLVDCIQAQNLVKKAHEEFGRLDVLVNNVGNYVRKPLIELAFDEWHHILDSNLNATFYTCQTALPLMRGSGGRIVNLGFAGAANLIARPKIVPYAIAKAGVILLTKAIAKSEASFGITANVVAPGVAENSVSKPLDEIPAGRLAGVDEIAKAVLFFVSEDTKYITGQVLEVAGGWNL